MTSVRIEIPTEIQQSVNDAVRRGAAPTFSVACERALSAWLKTQQAGHHPLDMSLDDYVKTLFLPRVSYHDESVNIDGPDSYVEELRYAEDAFKDYGSFSSMPLNVRKRVSGYGDSNGYVGRMQAARHFKPVVEDTPEQIAEHLDLLPLGGPVSPELAEATLRGLRQIRGLGIGSATRLLAAKRPDVFFPVNGANLDEVRKQFGKFRYQLPSGVDDYMRILGLVHTFAWRDSSRPTEGAASAAAVWRYRVALLDALLYAPDLDE